METRDTILRLIQQTALTLRAFFNSLPLEDESNKKQMEDFTSSLKTQTSVDIDILLKLETPQQMQNFFALHPSFDATNQELLADLLVALAEQTSLISKGLMYKKTALMLYLVINQTTQTHDWNRQEKINKLRLN